MPITRSEQQLRRVFSPFSLQRVAATPRRSAEGKNLKAGFRRRISPGWRRQDAAACSRHLLKSSTATRLLIHSRLMRVLAVNGAQIHISSYPIEPNAPRGARRRLQATKNSSRSRKTLRASNTHLRQKAAAKSIFRRPSFSSLWGL